MNKDILKDVMAHQGYTQARLAEKMGYAGQNAISEKFRRLEHANKFIDLVNAMGCEVIIRSEDGEEWVL